MKKSVLIMSVLCTLLTLFILPLPTKDNGIILHLELMTEQDINMRIYYTAERMEFNGEDSIKTVVEGNEDYQTVEIALPIERIQRLRLDFVEYPRKIIIRNAVLIHGDEKRDITTDLLDYNCQRLELTETEEGFIQVQTLKMSSLAFSGAIAFSADISSVALNYPAILFIAMLLFVLYLNIATIIFDNLLAVRAQYANIPIFILFLVIIIIPFAFREEFDPQIENRNASVKPALITTGALNMNYPTQYEDWFNDHFATRSLMMKTYAKCNYRFFEVVAANGVIIGKNHWLFYGTKLAGDPIAYYQNRDLYSQEELELIKDNLESLYNTFKEEGIEYLLVIARNKESIYPEYYPDSICKVNTTSKTEQVVQYLNEYSDIPVLDLRASLINEKENAELYYQADTHWNRYGGFIGYQDIAGYLAECFPAVKPLTLADFTITKTPQPSGDLIPMINIDNADYKGELFDYTFTPLTPYVYEETNSENAPVKQLWTAVQNPDLPTAMIYHDSFFSSIKPFLSNHFENAFYHQMASDIYFETEQILQEKPDVVIHEFIERRIDELLEHKVL